MKDVISVYKQHYSAAQHLLENNKNAAYQAFNNLLNSLLKDTSQQTEDRLHINELIIEVLLIMASCKASMTIINPNNDKEFLQNSARLDQAIKHTTDALNYFNSDTNEFYKRSLQNIQLLINKMFYTIHRTRAAIHYNYGCTLIEISHNPEITVSQSIDYINVGFQYLLDALSLYNQLKKSTSSISHGDEFKQTKDAIYQMINTGLNLLTANTVFLELKRANAQYQKEFTALKACYEKMLAFDKDHASENTTSKLNLLLNEKIADLYSILSFDKNKYFIKLAINHYHQSIDESQAVKDEKNIKICLSILGCYELIISLVHTPKEKLKYAYKMSTFMNTLNLINTSQLNVADALELSSYQFVASKTLAIHGEIIKDAQQFISLYENFTGDDEIKQNFIQTYLIAKKYVKKVEESNKAESSVVNLKRKQAIDPNNDATVKDNPNKFFKSTATGTKIRFHNIHPQHEESVAGSPMIPSGCNSISPLAN